MNNHNYISPADQWDYHRH